jgi:hypothetical protein
VNAGDGILVAVALASVSAFAAGWICACLRVGRPDPDLPEDREWPENNLPPAERPAPGSPNETALIRGRGPAPRVRRPAGGSGEVSTNTTKRKGK